MSIVKDCCFNTTARVLSVQSGTVFQIKTILCPFRYVPKGGKKGLRRNYLPSGECTYSLPNSRQLSEIRVLYQITSGMSFNNSVFLYLG